jgi:predicted DNA binding CopG/RHH family protein
MPKLPEFKTKKEEREFWDSHSSADYWEDMEDSQDTFKRPKLKTISLKLDPSLLGRIRVVAHKRGLSYNAMMRYLLSKGIEREIKDL